jgi:hypothetical protein
MVIARGRLRIHDLINSEMHKNNFGIRMLHEKKTKRIDEAIPVQMIPVAD